MPPPADASPTRGHLVVVTGLPGSGKSTLAAELAASLPALRMCADDWMMSAGIDLWRAEIRARIEAFQFELTLDLLSDGENVVVEWGSWTRAERDALRDAASARGATVELRYVSADIDELLRRITARDRERQCGGRAIEREDLVEWSEMYEPPTRAEFDTYGSPEV